MNDPAALVTPRWSPARDAIVRREYASYTRHAVVAVVVNATPGPAVTAQQVINRCSALKLSRPLLDTRRAGTRPAPEPPGRPAIALVDGHGLPSPAAVLLARDEAVALCSLVRWGDALGWAVRLGIDTRGDADEVLPRINARRRLEHLEPFAVVGWAQVAARWNAACRERLKVVLAPGFEPGTSRLPSECSTAELRQP